MTRPSKVGEGFLIIFGLFFAAFGLFAASTFFLSASGPTRSNGWVGLLFGAIFTLVGSGIIYGAIYGNRKLQEQAAVEQANPDSPWLWRKDWAASQADSKNRNSAIGLWLVAFLVDAIVFPIGASVLPKLSHAFDPKSLIPLLFCVAGVVLTGAAIRASIRRKRFGQTYFQFASLPFLPAGR